MRSPLRLAVEVVIVVLGHIGGRIVDESTGRIRIPERVDAGELAIVEPSNEAIDFHAEADTEFVLGPVALLLADLGVTKTHSRPHVSNDNPFSEAHFRTLKYCPQFPDRFGSIEDGRAFCQSFFRWYNHDHHHSGLGFLEPAVVHFGQAAAVRAHRELVLAAAYVAHPERFVNGPPRPADLPTAVWINPPVKKSTRQDAPGTTIVTPDDPQHGRITEATHRSTRLTVDGDAPIIDSTRVSQCH